MRKLLIAIAISSIVGAGLSACSQSDAKPTAAAEGADTAIAVETVQPKRGELVRTFAGTATLTAERAASLVSENGGEVLKIYVEEGDRVVAGQVLARIDGERARLALAQTASVAQRLDHEADRANQLLDKHMIAADAVERARFERDAQRAGGRAHERHPAEGVHRSRAAQRHGREAVPRRRPDQRGVRGRPHGDLAERLTALQHGQHDLTVATMHAHLDHENCLETVILKGRTETVVRFAQRLMAESGVRHGQFNVISVEPEHRHAHDGGDAKHVHYRPSR